MLNATKTLKAKLINAAARFNKDEKGNFAIMAAASVAVLVAGLSVAVDVSNGYFAKQRLQDTTDVIALAAARSEAQSAADLIAIAQAHLAVTFPGEIGASINLESITRDGAAVTVVASNVQPTYFAGIFGRNGLDIKAASTAEYEVRDLNLALVLDSTGSMGKTTPTGGTRLAALQAASGELLDQLDGSAGEVSISVVPFTQHVNVGTNQANENWLEFPQTNNNRAPNGWNGCVGSRDTPLNTRIDSTVARIPGLVNARCATTPILPLTKNLNTVRQTINSMTAKGSTYTPSGTAWGWRTLTPTAPFTQTRNQDQSKTDNVMVIMTDGNNTRSKEGIMHENKSQAPADRTMTTMCENAKRDGITIYTIALEIKDRETREVLEGCASQADGFFNASNGDELGDAFSQIATSLTVARISS